MRREEQLEHLKSVFDDKQTEALMSAFGQPKLTKDKVDEAWEKFLSYYPKRQGSNPKQEAYELFRQNCAKGEDPDALAYTAKAYRKQCETTLFDGKPIIGTSGVMQMVTFLRPSKRKFADYLPQGEEHKWTLEAKCAGDVDPRILGRWTSICSRLALELGEAKYKSYFDKLLLIEGFPDVKLKAESKFMADYVAQHFGNRLADLWGCPVRVVS